MRVVVVDRCAARVKGAGTGAPVRCHRPGVEQRDDRWLCAQHVGVFDRKGGAPGQWGWGFVAGGAIPRGGPSEFRVEAGEEIRPSVSVRPGLTESRLVGVVAAVLIAGLLLVAVVAVVLALTDGIG